MWKKATGWLLSIGLAATCGALAQADQDPFNLRSLPGFIDARELGITRPDEALVVGITVEGPMLAFLAEASRAADPELADALGRLKTVRARIYKLEPGDLPAARRQTEQAARKLEGKGWQRVVTLREEGAESYLYFKTDGSRILGLVALFVSADRQFGFINIAGEVDPVEIGRIARKFNIEVLEEAAGEAEEPEKNP